MTTPELLEALDSHIDSRFKDVENEMLARLEAFGFKIGAIVSKCKGYSDDGKYVIDEIRFRKSFGGYYVSLYGRKYLKTGKWSGYQHYIGFPKNLTVMP